MNENIELKPCPFCGSEDVRMGSTGCSIGVDIYIKCNCGAKCRFVKNMEKKN